MVKVKSRRKKPLDLEADWNRERVRAPKATRALPGTRAKIRVMTARVALDYQPFHPDDAKFDSAEIDRVLRAMAEFVAGECRGRRRR